jgi:hypothetical protein
LGTTSENEVVPRGPSPAAFSYAAPQATPFRGVAPAIDSAATSSAPHTRTPPHDGRRSLPPTAGTHAAISARRPRRGFDPGARASNGPAPVRRVAHAIAVGVDVAVDEALFGVQSRGDLWERCVTDGDAFRPDNLVPFVRKSESLNGTRSAAEVVADCGACGEVRSPFALGCTACHRAWLR